jgi:hypothetical protein
MNLDDNWGQVKDVFEEHFVGEDVRRAKDFIEYDSGRVRIRIERDGDFAAEMPLHTIDGSDLESFEIQDGTIVLKGQDYEYKFDR